MLRITRRSLYRKIIAAGDSPGPGSGHDLHPLDKYEGDIYELAEHLARETGLDYSKKKNRVIFRPRFVKSITIGQTVETSLGMGLCEAPPAERPRRGRSVADTGVKRRWADPPGG